MKHEIVSLTKDWEIHTDQDGDLYLVHVSGEDRTFVVIGKSTIPDTPFHSLESAVNLLRSNGMTTSKPN